MKSEPVALLLADLGATKTHSLSHVSDDNPYSESRFKTQKYPPGFPDRFGSILNARAFCRNFFPCYNEERITTAESHRNVKVKGTLCDKANGTHPS
jgi:putative transposase